MANCTTNKMVGKDCVLEYALGCGDEMPLTEDWKRFGGMRTKSLSAGWDTIDSTTDDLVGFVRENLATYQNFSISGDGAVLRGDSQGALNAKDLYKHFMNPLASGGQPVIWVRLTFPGFLRFTAFCIISTLDLEAPEELVTFSLELMATSSAFGVVVEDAPSGVAVTSVTVSPASLTLAIDDSQSLEATVLPANATQTVTYQSSAEGIARVDRLSGQVTGVAAGVATITATSTYDHTKTATSSVTVTE